MTIRSQIYQPSLEFDRNLSTWLMCSDVCKGEESIKAMGERYLIPFSNKMDKKQFNFYIREAEFPNIVSEFYKLLVGSMLKRAPTLNFSDNIPEEGKEWIMREFGKDGIPFTNFLYELLSKEIPTCRSWIRIDYTDKPIVEILPWHYVINWKVDKTTGELIQVLVREVEEVYSEENEFHAGYRSFIYVHELDEKGLYQVRTFASDSIQADPLLSYDAYQLIDIDNNILKHNERLDFIPIYPTNGSIEPIRPILTSLASKEIALYNKLSRRNHLLFTGSSYTPVIFSDIDDGDFESIVDRGLGSWIRLRSDDKVGLLETPTGVLADLNTAITNSVDEIAKLGVRMLAPETTQSGVALQLRNTAQIAQIDSIATQISNTLTSVVTFMVRWRYDIPDAKVTVELNTDMDKYKLSVEWLNLITDCYREKMLPRSVFIDLLRKNDILPEDYDDNKGQEEITTDETLIPNYEQR